MGIPTKMNVQTAEEMSIMKSISASLIQGSAIGPASYVVPGSDLRPVTSGNRLCKYTDERRQLGYTH